MALTPAQQALYESALLKIGPSYFPPQEVVDEAIAELERASVLGPDSDRLHALLGFIRFEQSRWPEATEQFRRAAELNPHKQLYLVNYLAALAHADNARALTELERVAPRYDVDVRALEAARRAEGLRDDDASALVFDAFYHAHNFLRSELMDELLLIQDRLSGVSRQTLRRREIKAYKEMQKEVVDSFHVARVPAHLRELADAVVRLGIGDDFGREYFFARLKKKERAALIARADALAPQVHLWLDGFGAGPLSAEAAAYMYFLLGIEETRPA